MDGLIESVDCEHRPHLNYMLTPKGLDEAVKIWGKQTMTVFIIYGGRMPGEDESTPIKLVPVTADGSDFDMASLPRGLRSEEHTSELQSLMRISYAAFSFKKNTDT